MFFSIILVPLFILFSYGSRTSPSQNESGQNPLPPVEIIPLIQDGIPDSYNKLQRYQLVVQKSKNTDKKNTENTKILAATIDYRPIEKDGKLLKKAMLFLMAQKDDDSIMAFVPREILQLIVHFFFSQTLDIRLRLQYMYRLDIMQDICRIIKESNRITALSYYCSLPSPSVKMLCDHLNSGPCSVTSAVISGNIDSDALNDIFMTLHSSMKLLTLSGRFTPNHRDSIKIGLNLCVSKLEKLNILCSGVLLADILSLFLVTEKAVALRNLNAGKINRSLKSDVLAEFLNSYKPGLNELSAHIAMSELVCNNIEYNMLDLFNTIVSHETSNTSNIEFNIIDLFGAIMTHTTLNTLNIEFDDYHFMALFLKKYTQECSIKYMSITLHSKIDDKVICSVVEFLQHKSTPNLIVFRLSSMRKPAIEYLIFEITKVSNLRHLKLSHWPTGAESTGLEQFEYLEIKCVHDIKDMDALIDVLKIKNCKIQKLSINISISNDERFEKISALKVAWDSLGRVPEELLITIRSF